MKNAQTKSEKSQNAVIRSTRTPVQLFLAELTTAQVIDMVAQLFKQHANPSPTAKIPSRPEKRIRNKS